MPYDFKDADTWDKDVILSWLLYRMTWDTRRALMRDLPQSYNRICGQEVVKVVRLCDGLDPGP